MLVSVRHSTRYAFSRSASHGLQRLRLTPRSCGNQRVREWSVDLEGLTREVQYEDQHENITMLVSVEAGATAVAVTCTGLVETTDNAGVLGRHTGPLPLWAYLGQTDLTQPGEAMQGLAQAVDHFVDRAPLPACTSLRAGCVRR